MLKVIKIFLTLAFFSFCFFAEGFAQTEWRVLYEDAEKRILVNKKIFFLGNSKARFRLYWEWSKPRFLKKTPGVSYSSRLEKLDIDFSRKIYKTHHAKLFDSKGDEIQFSAIIPSNRWDELQDGSLLGNLYTKLQKIAEKEGLMEDDLGLKAIGDLYRKLSIDDKWTVKKERGFDWWAGGLVQSISVDKAYDDDGIILYKLQARTALLKDFEETKNNLELLSIYGTYSSIASMVRDPNNVNKIQMVSTIWVHEQIYPQAVEYFTWAAIIQNIEAHIMADILSEALNAKQDYSAHPSTGYRVELDEMLNLVETLIAPQGKQPSLWNNQIMAELPEFINRADKWFSMGSESGVSAEFPYPGRTSLLQFITDESNPRMGNGLLVLIRTPLSGVDPKYVLELNEFEQNSEAFLQSIGSWCLQNGELNYVTFLPNSMYLKGMEKNLALWMMRRIEWFNYNFMK